jgi:hypothetical protein
MKKVRTKKQSILVLLIVLAIAINLNFLATMIKAGPYVPEEHANNSWHWGVDVGDELYWEVEFITTNASSGEVTMMFKDIWIYNITSIENVTIDYLGVNEFSQVNATQCYYNLTTDEIEPYVDPSEFALFGYNNSDSIQHKYRAGMGAAPYILPLNGSNDLEVDVLADILNDSLYNPLSDQPFNHFDDYSFNTGDNSITFTNSTDNYYMYMEFDPTDGIAEYAKGYIMLDMEEPTLLNFTTQRVYDYDVTDEVEWGVNVGDTIYYDWGDDWDYIEIEVRITSITEVMLPKLYNSFFGEEIPMVFEVVYANCSTWDGTHYYLEVENLPIGTANNFYFQYFDFEPSEFSILIPNNTLREDIEFMWNLDTIRIMDMPFTEVILNENGNFEFILQNSSSNFIVKTIMEKSTGITQSSLTQEGSYLVYYEIKNMTLVEWDVDIGDIVYYKLNSEDGEIYNRATIIATYGQLVNLTEWERDSEGLFTTIPGQPELQFFKAIKADFEEFDEETGTWQYEGDDLFLLANTYWPISPIAMFGATSPPLFIPLGFTGEDLEGLFGMFSTMFDEMTFTENRANLRNSTLDKEYDTYIDISTGQITFMGGWINMPDGDDTTWMHMTLYPMHNETLHPGTNSISVPSDAVSEITDSNIEIITNNTGVEVVNALLAYNPTNTSITNGTVLYYNDLLISNSTGLENLTFYIKFDDTFDLNNYKLTFWAWNMSGNNEWEAAPPEEIADIIVYNYADNSLTIHFPVEGSSEPISIIMAISYVYIGSDPTPGGIPGYPLLLTLGMLSIGLIALIVIHLKKVKKF